MDDHDHDEAGPSGGAAALLPPEDPQYRANFFDLEPDEDLDLSEAHHQAWLVKVPKFLYDGWSKVEREGVHLGTVRVYDAPEGKNPRMELLLPQAPAAAIPLTAEQLANFPEGQHVPRAYDLRLTDQAPAYGSTGGSTAKKEPRNLYALKERRPREDIEAEEAAKRAKRERAAGRGGDAEDDEDEDDDDDLDDLIDPDADDDDDEDVMPLSGGSKGKGRATDSSRPSPSAGGGFGLSATAGQKRKRPSKFRRHTALVGTVTNEAAASPQLVALRASMDEKKAVQAALAGKSAGEGSSAALDNYRKLMKVRSEAARKPKQKLIVLDEADDGLANRISSGMLNNEPTFATSGRKPVSLHGRRGPGNTSERFARLPRNELLDALFTLFEKEKYHSFSDLRQRTQQPEAYLREVLQSIAVMQQKGPYSGKWALRPEYSQSEARRNEQREAQRLKEEKEQAAAQAQGGDDDDGDDDDDD